MIDVILPLPPSVNAIWRTGNGRTYKNPKFDGWRREAASILKKFYALEVIGRYSLEMRLPLAMRGDIDNRVKAMADLLAEMRLTADDKNMFRLLVLRSPDVVKKTCRVIVMPFTI